MCTLFVRLGKAETRFQDFFGRDGTVESTVVLLYFGLFLLVEPTTLSAVQFFLQLGIQLSMIYGCSATSVP